MQGKATVRLKFLSFKELEIVLKALTPEIKKPINPRSKVSFKKERSTLILKIRAKDTVALRATLNSYLRWVDSTRNVVKFLESKQYASSNQ